MTNWAKALGDVGYFQPELEKVSTVLTNLHNLEKQKRIADQIKTKIQGLGTTSDKPVAATTAKPAQTVKTETKTPTSIADLMANKPPEDVVDRPAVIDTPTAAPKEPQFFASTRLYGMPADDNIDRPFVGGQPALGNVDLFNRKAVALNDGSGNRATVNSASFNIDGKEVLLPTVSDDGKLLSNDEAIVKKM